MTKKSQAVQPGHDQRPYDLSRTPGWSTQAGVTPPRQAASSGGLVGYSIKQSATKAPSKK